MLLFFKELRTAKQQKTKKSSKAKEARNSILNSGNHSLNGSLMDTSQNIQRRKETVMSEKDMKKHFLNEPGLKFVPDFIYPNGSAYSGQMNQEERHGFGVQ